MPFAGLLLLPLLQTGCELPYILTQGYYQIDLITGRTSIYKAMRDPDLNYRERVNLKRAISVKEFSEGVLGLEKNKNFTTVNLKWKRKIYNVQASERLRFRSYYWKFPIIGKVPYKGFFCKEDAEKELKRLEGLGYEGIISRVKAYSTLGFFKDPITRDALNLSETRLINMIIHELVHSTLFIKGETEFNESLANFVAREGTLLYLKFQKGMESEVYRMAVAEFEDDLKFNALMNRLYIALEKLYGRDIPEEEKLTKKSGIIKMHIDELRATPFRVRMYFTIPEDRFNNAFILSHRLYNYRFDYFENLFRAAESDMEKFLVLLRRCLKEYDGPPFERLRQHLKGLKEKG